MTKFSNIIFWQHVDDLTIIKNVCQIWKTFKNNPQKCKIFWKKLSSFDFAFLFNKLQTNGLFSFLSKVSVVFMVYNKGAIAWSQVFSQLTKVISIVSN